eukprot:747923-Hanusia_phi.AAC.1
MADKVTTKHRDIEEEVGEGREVNRSVQQLRLAKVFFPRDFDRALPAVLSASVVLHSVAHHIRPCPLQIPCEQVRLKLFGREYFQRSWPDHRMGV